MKKSIFSIIVTTLSASSLFAQLFTPGNGATDIDGNTYSTIVMSNGQEWFAENLTTTRFANGDTIPYSESETEWTNSGISALPAWCWYDGDSEYDEYYGKLYNWYAAADSRNVCPDGWDTPTRIEWDILLYFLDPNAAGNTNVAGGMLKSIEPWLWTSPNIDATNSSGFSGRPHGWRAQNGVDAFIQDRGYFWTSTTGSSSTNAWQRMIRNDFGFLSMGELTKRTGMGVRCLKNPTVTSLVERSEESLHAYPNPSYGMYQIEGTGTASVYNALGENILTKTIQGKSQVDLTVQPEGIYFLKFEGENGIQTKKLIKR